MIIYNWSFRSVPFSTQMCVCACMFVCVSVMGSSTKFSASRQALLVCQARPFSCHAAWKWAGECGEKGSSTGHCWNKINYWWPCPVHTAKTHLTREAKELMHHADGNGICEVEFGLMHNVCQCCNFTLTVKPHELLITDQILVVKSDWSAEILDPRSHPAHFWA